MEKFSFGYEHEIHFSNAYSDLGGNGWGDGIADGAGSSSSYYADPRLLGSENGNFYSAGNKYGTGRGRGEWSDPCLR